jgi:Mg2+/Co2+ transporter CorB
MAQKQDKASKSVHLAASKQKEPTASKSKLKHTKKQGESIAKFKKIFAFVLIGILIINLLLFAFVRTNTITFWLVILGCYIAYKLTFKNTQS